jgi:molybdenum cofactor guanylyltransferase
MSDNNGTTSRTSFPKASASTVQAPKMSAAILAGGRSKRMGRDKALLQIGDKTMIEHVAEMVQSQAPEVMIVSNKQETYRFLGLPVYPDAVHGCGPLGGIYTALLYSKHRHCLVVACDLPFLNLPLLRFLCENCRPHDVLVFESETGVEPLCAVYSKNCLPAIEKHMKAGKYKVSDFYETVSTRVVKLKPELAFYDGSTFLNVNTPEDLAEARNVWNRFFKTKY